MLRRGVICLSDGVEFAASTSSHRLLLRVAVISSGSAAAAQVGAPASEHVAIVRSSRPHRPGALVGGGSLGLALVLVLTLARHSLVRLLGIGNSRILLDMLEAVAADYRRGRHLLRLLGATLLCSRRVKTRRIDRAAIDETIPVTRIGDNDGVVVVG